jgi:hypothetical protein
MLWSLLKNRRQDYYSVLLAKYHHQLGHMHKHKLPTINTLPAYHKPGEAGLTPDLFLQAFHDAQQQIAAVLNFFRF